MKVTTNIQEQFRNNELKHRSRQNLSIWQLLRQHPTKHNLSIWQLSRHYPTASSIIIGLLAVGIVFLWKDIENGQQKTLIMNVANKQIETDQQDQLKLIVKPMVWSIRSEMLRGNLEQVNILITNMVKEKNFRYIHIIAPDGSVILSTNKSFKRKLIGSVVDPSLLLIDSPEFETYIDNVLVVAAPVMGVDRRLATLIVGYATTRIKLE